MIATIKWNYKQVYIECYGYIWRTKSNMHKNHLLIPFCNWLLKIRFCRASYEVSTWHTVFSRNGNTLSRDVFWRPLRKSLSLRRSCYLAKNPHPFLNKYLCVDPLWLIIIHKNFSFCSIFLNFQIHFIKNLSLPLLLTIDPILKLEK